VVVLRERNWWLILSACVLAVLFVMASVLAVEQHNAANKWMRDYHVQVSDYHAEVHKNVGLYASLVFAHHQLSACVSDANRVLFDIDAYLRNGFLPTSSRSDATTAGQACQTTTQATGPN
jgi:hypothetical protein